MRGRVIRWILLALVTFSLRVPAAAPDTGEDHFARAGKLVQNGSLEQAVAEYQAGLKLHPADAQAWKNLGALYFQPHNSEINFNLGLALYQAGRAQRAIGYLEVASRAAAHAAEAHFLLGVARFELKQWRLSVDELELARGNQPGTAELLFVLVKAYRNAGEPKKSLDAVAQFLKLYPDSPLLHEMLGEAHDEVSEPEGAEAELKAAIAGAPQAPQLHFLLGYFYWRWTRFEEAIAPLEQETRLNPGFAPAYFSSTPRTAKQNWA